MSFLCYSNLSVVFHFEEKSESDIRAWNCSRTHRASPERLAVRTVCRREKFLTRLRLHKALNAFRIFLSSSAFSRFVKSWNVKNVYVNFEAFPMSVISKIEDWAAGVEHHQTVALGTMASSTFKSGRAAFRLRNLHSVSEFFYWHSSPFA